MRYVKAILAISLAVLLSSVVNAQCAMCMSGAGASVASGGGTASTFLLHLDGSQDSTTVTDVIGHTWAANGSAHLDTAVEKFGTAAGMTTTIAGGDTFTSSHNDYIAGTGDFTYEGWFRPYTVSGAGGNILVTGDGGTTGFSLYYTGAMGLFFYANSGNRITGPTLSFDTWYYFAVERLSGVTKLWLGTSGTASQEGSNYTDANNYSGNQVAIGEKHQGHFDDMRGTIGAARYVGNAPTVPTGAFPDL